jgi:cell volume regulation protein A
LFRDFELASGTPIGAVCEFYALPAPDAADVELTLGSWMARQLRRPPVAGDNVSWGPATFVVRELQDGRITRVGLGLAS